MKSLAWINAENSGRSVLNEHDRMVKRLKQRVANLTHSPQLGTSRKEMRKQLNAVIDAWFVAERKRGLP